MNKTEFIAALRRFVKTQGVGMLDEYSHPDYRPSRGETILAAMLADYLERPDVSDTSEYINWFAHMPQIIVAAFEAFRTDPAFEVGRKAYAVECDGREIPDLVDVYAGGIYRQLVAMSVCRLIPWLSGEQWLRGELDGYLNAEMKAIDHAWRRFVRTAYRKLIVRINAERHRGNSGMFGSTMLTTWAGMGRVVFTFERPDGEMTFIVDDGDPIGLRSGANHPGAPYATCITMIDEVTRLWDDGKLKPITAEAELKMDRFKAISEELTG